MACSQYYSGNEERGNFYSNQFDPLLLEYNIYGKVSKPSPMQSTGQVNLQT